MDKINRLQVWIIGGVLALISAAVIWFALISPSQAALADADRRYEAAKAVADTRQEKVRALATAKRELAKAQSDWNVYQRRFMPNIDLRNLYVGMTQLWNEQLNVLGPKVNNFLRKDKKVEIQANIALPPPPTDPNAVNQKVFVYDLGSVAVAGTFNDVLNHVARWNNFDRLVLADGLTLAGNSPRLVGTYSLRAFVFTRNSDNPGASWPAAAPGTGGGTGGAFGSGGPRGMMGMSGRPGASGPPPGMSGGPSASASPGAG